MSHGEGGLVIAFVTFLHVLLLWQMSGEQFPDFIIMYFCRLYQSELNYKYWWSDRHLGTTARTSRRYIYSVTVIVDSSRSCDLCVICTFLDLLTPHYYNGQFTSIGACHNSYEFICQQSSGTLNPGWSQDTIHGIIPTTMQWSFNLIKLFTIAAVLTTIIIMETRSLETQRRGSAGCGLDGLW